MKKFRIMLMLIAVGLTTLLLAQPSLAAVSAEEAKALGITLTEFGAEKAGNKDGSIPPYTGGIGPEDVPAYNSATMPRYIDPYANEEPDYTITASNMKEYESVLSDGVKTLFEKYPDYRMDVYPSHRTDRYPACVLENCLKNATTAKLSGKIEGDSVTGADKEHGNQPFPGIPFPIPKNGYEAMWNHLMRCSPAVEHACKYGLLVDTAGRVTRLPEKEDQFLYPWYDQSGKLRKKVYDSFFGFMVRMTWPPTTAGGVFLNLYQVGGQKVWFYSPGQRRIRMAPEFAYDVPIASYGGLILWDEIFGFVGRMDRFNFKLVGKKEMIIPYNSFNITMTIPDSEMTGKKFLNPKAVRWEKHRVWMVEADRKPGARHVYKRRVFYLDEDAWCVVIGEGFDDSDTLYRLHLVFTYPPYDVGGINDDCWATYDLIKGNYFIINPVMRGSGGFVRHYTSAEGLDLQVTPQEVQASGIR